ncbi:MAG: hypothetical protein F4213_22360 [Boseongicola sp. SB0677_bin_26]|nr:hypothetical protein [Boseongicola sp. SB0665_bin_10]MYG28723.1 hypothetical protein [Boseongicola sp. SB0677_bin_26]
MHRAGNDDEGVVRTAPNQEAMESRATGLTRFEGPIMGPNARALKYDILTALQVLGAHGDYPAKRLALRLSFLMTARYNWPSRSFSVGIQELARMWNISERSAIRDMVQMRKLGWLTVVVPAAKGRVAHHRIDLPTVLKASMPFWDAVGRDFSARMAGVSEQAQPEGTGGSNVVPLRPDEHALPEDNDTGWQAAALRLMQHSPNNYRNWFSQLAALSNEDGVLTLQAPTAFAAHHLRTHLHTQVLAAVVATNPSARDVKFEGPPKE